MVIGGRLDCAVTNREKRSVMALVGRRRRTTSWRCRWPGGGAGGAGPFAGGADRLPRTGRTPLYGARERDSLCLSPATGSDLSRSHLSRSQFISGRTGRIFPAQKTAPSFSTDGYLAENL